MGYNIRSVTHYGAPVGYNIALVGLLCYPGGLLYYPGLLFYLRGQLPGAPATGACIWLHRGCTWPYLVPLRTPGGPLSHPEGPLSHPEGPLSTFGSSLQHHLAAQGPAFDCTWNALGHIWFH